jgi:tRNA A37 methylthiotransferase MiaB
MANPQYLLPRIDALIDVLKHPNMFRFLHLPVQAGSDNVLLDMKRGYRVAMFKQLVQKLTRAIPDITIATDIIVGFPTETQEDFEQTVRLIEETKVPVVNISKFYPRPNTPAAKLNLLPTHIVKERSTRLKKVCETIAKERNASFIGKELSVIIDEPGKKQGSMIARADNYVQVICKEGVVGERKTIKPSSAGVFDVRA